MCSFNRGNIERTNSSKICIWCLCMFVLFYIRIGFIELLEKANIYLREGFGFVFCPLKTVFFKSEYIRVFNMDLFLTDIMYRQNV